MRRPAASDLLEPIYVNLPGISSTPFNTKESKNGCMWSRNWYAAFLSEPSLMWMCMLLRSSKQSRISQGVRRGFGRNVSARQSQAERRASALTLLSCTPSYIPERLASRSLDIWSKKFCASDSTAANQFSIVSVRHPLHRFFSLGCHASLPPCLHLLSFGADIYMTSGYSFLPPSSPLACVHAYAHTR